MIKYLECPDLHSDERWIETTLQCLDKIIETAKKEKVDFVTLSGDLHNKNFYLTKAYNQLRQKLKQLAKVCPVCAIAGTPGHENEEMLKPLEDIGVVLLRPNNVYGYFDIRGCNKIIENLDKSTSQSPNCILFGVSELTTKNILAKTSMTAEQANKEVVKLFEKYIDEYVAPMRLKYQNVLAVMLFHGEVSDSLQENSNDIITKSSNIVIHTEIFERANLDRISLGHRHIPWESEKICAGYAGYCGIDDKPWGYLDFVPRMNMVEIDDRLKHITPIPYGTPMRKKITQPLDFYDPEIAYWIVTDNPEFGFTPGQVHPWSRITYEEKRIETQRITKEQAEKITCLADLFKLIDPAVTKKVLKKVSTIQKQVPEVSHKQVNFKLLGIEIAGCTLFKKILKWDLGKLPSGLNSLMGDNGAGKSSTVSFCHPYPTIIGKDTNSGRISAIKDFFNQQVSYIKKWVIVNGVEHIHNIQIQGAHTKSPKVVCALTIDGKPILDKGTFDEMFSKCEELYGSYSDYMLTSFYVQPLQSRNGTSGLMMANMTDIRDLVQSIAGVDRENEKRYSLDEVAKIKQEITNIENWLQGAEQFDIDIEPIKIELKELLSSLEIKKIDSVNAENELKEINNKYKILYEDKIKNDATIKQKIQDTNRVGVIEGIIIGENNRIEVLIAKSSQKSKIENRISIDIKAQELEKKQNEKVREHEKILSEYRLGNFKITSAIKNLNNRSRSITEKIQILDKKCPQCGYIDPENKKQIEELQVEFDIAIPIELKKYKELAALLVKPIEPFFPKLIGLLASYERTNLQNTLNEINSSDKLIIEIEKKITEFKTEQANLQSQKYNVDMYIESKLSKIDKNIETKTHLRNGLLQTISANEIQIKNKQDSIEKAEKVKAQIKEKKNNIKIFQIDLIDWKYIASMLQSDKIPALELSIIVDSIDAEANRLIVEYENGRYMFKTITQDISKNGLKDIFDIKIYDSEIGKERSFLKHSVGEKAFFNDAYVKALIRKRNERMHRNYSPIISDEADAPIQPHRIQEYYGMQKKYFEDKSNQVIVISHAPDTHNYIQNNINVKDLLRN